MSKYTEDDLKVELENKEYEYGFYTELDSETFPIGLSEDIVRAISNKKEVVNALEKYILNLTHFKDLLEKDKYDEVFHEMQNTNRIKEILK
jgi:Fe-S cluster assembly protein SufB